MRGHDRGKKKRGRGDTPMKQGYGRVWGGEEDEREGEGSKQRRSWREGEREEDGEGLMVREGGGGLEKG